MTEKENSRIGVNSSSIGGGIGFGQTQMSTSFSGASQSATLISGLTSNQVCQVLSCPRKDPLCERFACWGPGKDLERCQIATLSFYVSKR